MKKAPQRGEPPEEAFLEIDSVASNGHKTKPQLRMLKLLTSLIALCLLASQSRGESDYVLRRSSSEQFTVYGPQASPIRHYKSERVPLDSALAAVSCERIKQALHWQLDGSARRYARLHSLDEGKIFLVLHTRLSQPVVITPVPTPGPLNYRIDLPNEIEAPRFIEAVTETLLLEMANRNAASFAQIPRWLVQGLSAQVQAIAPETLVLEPHLPITRVKTGLDVISDIRRNNTNFFPLTFDELSWPEMLSRDKAEHFQKNAQVLVAELLRLKNGPACMREMLRLVPNHPQWQVAFMQAFESQFKQLVDAEKWWDLTIVELTSSGPGRILPPDQALERMDATLKILVEVFHDFGTKPKRNDLSLQQVISDWEPERQRPALRKTVNQLRVLRSRLNPELARMADDYVNALENYLRGIEKNALLRRALFQQSISELRKSTSQKLDLLDKRRADLRAVPQPRPSTREEAMRSALEIASQRANKKSTRQ